MADRYEGPATLRIGDVTLALKDVTLWTTDTEGTYSWDGMARTLDLRAFQAHGQGGTLTLPSGGEGETHVAVVEPHEEGGLLLRLHGSSRPAPYA